eukprot:CAMPEP_0197847332 /NCGR_PEP_ID=MMETSP1438-20131217/5719_1 /TAXON_ID=1461541 /ORGANISM="Pterosperma sp., Strain CCMP1384" /LENGTH=217 /DNA_ID=CAMNT_0043459219 /DNA_START=136 /DNA_END=789 /DNA_ORIENTATION=+
MAVVYDGGIVIGCDTRVSTGTYISNRTSDKITPLSDNVFLARSGSAADTQLVSDNVRHIAEQHSITIGEDPEVKTVANFVMQLVYNNKNFNQGMGLTAAMVLAGWDKQEGGQVFAIPIGGSMVQVPWAVDGSGSTYIWGFIDGNYREGMTREETEEFIIKALALAMARDGSSGGMVRLVTVNKDGSTRRLVTHEELPPFFEELDLRNLRAGSGGVVL